MFKTFASDNYAPAHPKILQALIDANIGHAKAYGGDPYTIRAQELFTDIFGNQAITHFVFNGTGANILALKSLCERFSAIITSEHAHINTDECAAPEANLGVKIFAVKNDNGKITPEQIKPLLNEKGNEHRAQPKVVSISQTTELGTVYTCEEIFNLANFSHENNMYLHVDGARIANAAVALNTSFNEIITQTGVDVISFGGTKNGLLFGEAVVFPRGQLNDNFLYLRKQSMQLFSKNRYIAAQFIAYLEQNIWQKNALNANNMAKLFATKLQIFSKIELINPVEANALFAKIPSEWISKLQEKYPFYVWDNQKSIVRWMTSFDTLETEINSFIEEISLLSQQ